MNFLEAAFGAHVDLIDSLNLIITLGPHPEPADPVNYSIWSFSECAEIVTYSLKLSSLQVLLVAACPPALNFPLPMYVANYSIRSFAKNTNTANCSISAPPPA